MDLEYEGKLPDGTMYRLRVSFEDEKRYRKVVHALEEQKSKGIVEGGLLKILSDLDKSLSKEENLHYES